MSKYKKNLVDWYSQVKLFFLHGRSSADVKQLKQLRPCRRDLMKKGTEVPFHYYGVARFYSSFWTNALCPQ
jgi:hypothetical protein